MACTRFCRSLFLSKNRFLTWPRSELKCLKNTPRWCVLLVSIKYKAFFSGAQLVRIKINICLLFLLVKAGQRQFYLRRYEERPKDYRSCCYCCRCRCDIFLIFSFFGNFFKVNKAQIPTFLSLVMSVFEP